MAVLVALVLVRALVRALVLVLVPVPVLVLGLTPEAVGITTWTRSVCPATTPATVGVSHLRDQGLQCLRLLGDDGGARGGGEAGRARWTAMLAAT